MRIICVEPHGILDTATGEVTDKLDIEKLLTTEPGGVIAGNQLYPILCKLVPAIRKDEGWTLSISAQRQRVNPLNPKETRVKGLLYVSRLTYRRGKVRKPGERKRPPAIKWLVLNLELFTETQDVLAAAESLIGLAGRRGIKPRHSPGGFGAAMLRASSEWVKGRQPAPRFISEIAREHLPGNFYAVNAKHTNKGGKPLDHCYYFDQQSAHHKIASSVVLPHPAYLRARGRLRKVEQNSYPCWVDAPDLRKRLRRHVGLLCVVVDCATIPDSLLHLYPPWAHERGKQARWIWTPELRLLDRRTQLRHVACALTSIKIDAALWEYSEWALEQLQRPDKQVIKSSLLAAYGMLAVKQDGPVQRYTVHGRDKPPRAELCELPLLKDVYRSTVHRIRTPTLQNVVARGVIEAETRTRSILYARQLEEEGIPVAQIYADGLLAVTDQAPLLIPEHWRIAESLTRVVAPHPNWIVSDQLTKLPGLTASARSAYLKKGRVSREREPNMRSY